MTDANLWVGVWVVQRIHTTLSFVCIFCCCYCCCSHLLCEPTLASFFSEVLDLKFLESSKNHWSYGVNWEIRKTDANIIIGDRMQNANSFIFRVEPKNVYPNRTLHLPYLSMQGLFKNAIVKWKIQAKKELFLLLLSLSCSSCFSGFTCMWLTRSLN